MNPFHPYLSISEEVQEALNTKKPVVALESTIISHGLPFPENLEIACDLEKIIRSEGAIPATIALLDGKICLGISENNLEKIGGEAAKTSVVKVSRRDLANVLVQKKAGATTVAATMFCAQLGGIKIFATGGIGGVHRNGENTLDVSADLYELSKTNVAVVCAGVKSILDIGRTLEVLESFGVPVIGFKTEYFPAFFSRKSGYHLDYSLEKLEDVVGMLKCKWELGLEGGVLIANPIPEEKAMDAAYVEGIIRDALSLAAQRGITGKALTPFLMAELVMRSKGATLEANSILVKNNAKVAAQIACKFSQIQMRLVRES